MPAGLTASASAAIAHPPTPAPQIHDGRTVFARLSRTFASVRRVPSASAPDAPRELDLSGFLDACLELSCIYDRMGAMLGPAKKDMVSNLATIRAGVATRTGIASVQDAVRYDMQHCLCFHQTRDRKGVSFGLLWLVRALRFIDLLFANHDPRHPTFGGAGGTATALGETRHCASDAYARSIKPFHGRLLSLAFGGMMGQMPTRRKFLAELGRGGDGVRAAGLPADEACVYREMAAFRAVYHPMVDELHAFFVRHGLDDPWKA